MGTTITTRLLFSRPSIPVISLLISVSLCFANAKAQWRTNQRSHTLTQLTDNELVKLSRMTDMAIFKQLLKPILVPRIVESPQHKQVALYLKRKVEEYGFQTEWDRFADNTPYGQKTFRNLIATFDPMAPRRFVLACHYDSKIMAGQVFIGATDSAVPCAMMLDIARTLGPLLYYRTNKHITLQLIFLDGEEAFVNWSEKDSVYGARHLADLWARKWYPSTDGSAFELSKEIDRIDVFMLLDLLGASNTRLASTYGHGTTEFFKELPRIESRLKSLNTIKQIPQIFYSGISYAAVEDDHVPFMQKGVPIMHLISVPFPNVWHTVNDNESALDYNSIENIISILRVFVAEYLGIRTS